MCVAGKNVNFYAKKSNQVAGSGRFRHDHAVERSTSSQGLTSWHFFKFLLPKTAGTSFERSALLFHWKLT